jgi:hypothetical protein
MINKKEKTTVISETKASVNRKKLCVLFIFICMLINGFAFSTVEIGRYSLFMITITATQNVVSEMIGKCNESLSEVTNMVYEYLRGILIGNEGQRNMEGDEGKGGDREGKGEKGGDWTSGIMVKSLEKEIKSIIKDGEKAVGASVAGESFGWVTEGRYAAKEAGVNIILIMFIIFIAGIMRRKGREEFESNNIGKWKTRISA